MIKFFRVSFLIQDNWSIFEKSSGEKNCHSSISDIMKKLYSLLLILTPIKKVHAEERFCLEMEQTLLQLLITFCRV